MALKRLGRKGGATPAVAPPSKNLPAVSGGADGGLMISAGKYARGVVLSVFEQIGGQDTMAAWARDNQGEFYTKLFAKTITREVEEKRADTVEDLLEAIDTESEVVAIDAEFEDVKHDG